VCVCFWGDSGQSPAWSESTANGNTTVSLSILVSIQGKHNQMTWHVWSAEGAGMGGGGTLHLHIHTDPGRGDVCAAASDVDTQDVCTPHTYAHKRLHISTYICHPCTHKHENLALTHELHSSTQRPTKDKLPADI
jgi:hypothetical protein